MKLHVVMPRIMLLLFGACLTTMLFVTKCGMNFDSPEMSLASGAVRMRALESVVGRGTLSSAEELTKQLLILQLKVAELEDVIKAKDATIVGLETKMEHLKSQLEETRSLASKLINKTSIAREDEIIYQEPIRAKIKESELTSGVQLNNEFELIPFCRFTLTRIYLVDPGMGKRVVEKPIGFKKRDLLEAVSFGLEKLNGDRRDAKYSGEDFYEGIYRTEPHLGTHYELFFRDIDNPLPTNYRRVIVTRPYAPLHEVSSTLENTKKELINLILPLSGRVDKFQTFMDRFRRVCISHDRRVFLTVVYFGSEGLKEVKDIIVKVSKESRFKNIKLITLTDEQFSRGRGLQIGAQSWTTDDVLMFLCDVDIVFSTDFLERCRLHTERGKRVYYPMVFSLYNPKVVYSLQELTIPPEQEQLVISKDAGFWRDFGFGMTCQYRSDFLRIKGFDEKITGWGLEDTYLYRKYVKSDIMVVRATDPGIFHLWHEKYCDPQLPPDQYRGCIRSKALNEASHSQLGMLAFKEEIDIHKNLLNKSNR